MTKKDQVIVIPRRVSEQDKDKARRLTVMYALWTMLDTFKKQTDPVTWMKFGAPVEEFLECLETGRPHPVLDAWQQYKSAAANRAAPSSRETSARRLAVLACVTLERMGKAKQEARQFVAKHLAAAAIFTDAPSPETLRNWRRDLRPLLTPEDQTLIESAQARAGTDYKAAVDYFIGLMQAIHSPATVMKVLRS